MKEILELVVKNLVDDKDSVSINEVKNDKNIVFQVKVASSEMGKIIGKQGRVAKSIRSIIKAIAIKEHVRVNVEFLD